MAGGAEAQHLSQFRQPEARRGRIIGWFDPGGSRILNDVATTEEQAMTIREIALAHAGRPGALLPLLHAIQDQAGYVPDTAVPIVAEVLNLSRAEVHGLPAPTATVSSARAWFGSAKVSRPRF